MLEIDSTLGDDEQASSPDDEADELEDLDEFELDDLEDVVDDEVTESEGEKEQYTINTPKPLTDNFVLLDIESDPDEPDLLDVDVVPADVNAQEVIELLAEYVDDPEILEDFLERQLMPLDTQRLLRLLRSHHSKTPDLSAGDVDAAWDQADTGDETASVEPTPDQDIVEEIGEALGVTYRDDEPLDFIRKVLQRDRERWELDPASAEDELDELDEDEDVDVVEVEDESEVLEDEDEDVEI